jgi:hypothetical protein
MVVNACATMDDVDFGQRIHSTKSSKFGGRNKGSILYKSRSMDLREKRSFGGNNMNKILDFSDWRDAREQVSAAGRARSTGRSRTPTNTKMMDGKARSSTLLAKKTRTESLRTMEGRKNNKTPTKSRPTTPLLRGRSTEKKRSTTPVQHRARSKSTDRRPIIPSKRPRSYDLKKVSDAALQASTFGDRIKLAMSPKQRTHHLADEDDFDVPIMGMTSRYAARSVERPIFESSRTKLPFADHKPDTDMLQRPRTPTLFEHTKREQAAEATGNLRRPQPEPEKEDDWRPQETKQRIKTGLDPVEMFRHAYKKEDAEEPILSVTTRQIGQMFSDLSCSSAGLSNTIKSPHQKVAALEKIAAPISPHAPSNYTSRNPSTLKALAIEFTDSLSDVPNSKSTGYSGPDSPLSIGDNDDRYIMISDNNDEFTEAARHRLNSKSPLVPAVRNTLPAILKKKEIDMSPSGKNADKAGFKPGKESRDDEQNFQLLGQWRTTQPNRLLTPKRKATPGRAMGQSRSFVDQAEDKLNAIKEKREIQEFEEQYFGKKTQTKWEPQQGKTEKPTYDTQTGVADYSMSHATKSAASKVQREKKSAVKKFQKAGNALFGALLTGGRDKKVASQNQLTSPSNLARGVVMDTFHLREAGNSQRGLAAPLSPSNGGKLGENKATVKLTPRHPAKQENGWWGRKKNGGSIPTPRGGIYEVYNRDSVSSGRSGGTSTKSGKGTCRFGRRRIGESVGGSSEPDSRAEDSAASSKQSNDISSFQVMQRMTTFDSIIKDLQQLENKAPKAEFAVVEIGEDEDTFRTHSILVNKRDVEQQLTSWDPNQENASSVANSSYGLAPINEMQDERDTNVPIPLKKTKKIMDDSSIDNLQLTVSFADQLHQLKRLQKPPFKVPRGAYMM